MSIWVQVSAGHGNVPKECCWTVTRVAREIERDATAASAELLWIEPNSDEVEDTNHSVVFSLKGEEMPSWLRPYLGTIQWIGESPFRPHHKRKNWFVSVDVLEQPSASIYDWSKVRYETFRSSGPGGQNVNKVSSAVRAIYTPNGVSAEAQDQRSQQQNRSIALERLKRRLQSQEDRKQTDAKQELWSMHSQLERGNSVRVYHGPKFQLKK
jgi:peptide chain release factor